MTRKEGNAMSRFEMEDVSTHWHAKSAKFLHLKRISLLLVTADSDTLGEQIFKQANFCDFILVWI